MNKTDRILICICLVMVTIASFIAISVNGKSKFMALNIGQVLSILITGVVFFNITNVIASRGKKNDKFMELVEKLQNNIEDERIMHITSREDVDFIRIRTRKLANIIHCMQTMEIKNDEVKKHIDYIKAKLDDYEEITTNHFDDIGHLEKSEKDLKNKIELIDSKCDQIKVELYK